MNPLDRLVELWSDYLEGELSDEGLSELRALIADQPDFKAMAIEQYQVHRALGLISHEVSEAFVDATLKRVSASSEDFVSRVVARVSEQAHTEVRSKNAWLPIQASWQLVALAIIAATLLFIFLYRGPATDTSLAVSGNSQAEAKFTHTARTKFLGAFAPQWAQRLWLGASTS